MPKIGTVYVGVRAKLDRLRADFVEAKKITAKGAKAIGGAMSALTLGHPALASAAILATTALALRKISLSSIDVAADFERMAIKLNKLTDGRGVETLEEINAWALEMPVNTQEATRSFVTMQAMGLEPTIKKMQSLTDIASIFGEEALGRVSLALGQMSSMGRLSAQDLNQLAQVGISSRKILRDAFGMSVKEIQESGIEMNRILEAFWQHFETNFGGAAKEAMGSWQGLVVTFKGYIVEIQRVIMDAGIFEILKDELKKINQALRDWLKENKDWIKNDLPELVKEIKWGLEVLWEATAWAPKQVYKIYNYEYQLLKNSADAIQKDFTKSADEWEKRFGPNSKIAKEREKLRKRTRQNPWYTHNDEGESADIRLTGGTSWKKTKQQIIDEANLVKALEAKRKALEETEALYLRNAQAASKAYAAFDAKGTYNKYADMVAATKEALSGLEERGGLSLEAFEAKEALEALKEAHEIARQIREETGGTVFSNVEMDNWRTFYSELDTMTEETAKNMESTFSDFFFDAMRGELKSLSDYFQSFLTSIQRMISNFMAQKLVQQMFSNFGGWGSNMGTNWGNGQFSMGSGGWTGRAMGGFVDEHIVGVGMRSNKIYELGEKGPEAVLPLNRISDPVRGGARQSSAPGVVINIENKTGQEIQSSKVSEQFDGKSYIIGVVMDAHERNVNGFRDRMG